ncbi:MAG: DUF3618 domain-containing protein [Caldilineaceae bacterium]|nr:DUF3618 domain-containing protein [Caldilineaceae bacterium]
MTNHDNESPAAIKTDIERTRQNMSHKIDQIQARLHPDHLKAQAQETVRDLVRESTESLTSYLSENSKELGASVAQAIKSNPIPAALIGVGIGWLLMENYGASHPNQPDYRRGSSGWPRDDWQPNDRPAQAWYPESEARYAGASASAYGAQYQDQSPSPYQGQYQGAGGQYQNGGYDQPRTAPYRTAQGYGETSRPSAQANWTHDEPTGLREQVGEKVEELREGVQHVGEQVREQVSHVGEQVGEQASQLGEQMSHMGEQAQAYARQTGQQLQRSLEDNPLVFGGVALAIGALIGLALPETRRENQLMGEWRDEVVHSAQNVAQDAVERAKQVAEEVRPQLEQTAQKVVSDLKQSGQDALAEVKESGKEALDGVKQAGRAALDETKQTGQAVANRAQQAANESAEKVKQEADRLGEKAKADRSNA